MADSNILEIRDHIADDNIAAADRWVDRIDEQLRVLTTQPMMGRACEELAPGLRSYGVWKVRVSQQLQSLRVRDPR